ncbi:MAG: hypothetical protein M3Q29_12145 [Chloroflexota bacterium]|nr:hypothetical protein [Chloroflexota bacterium]
MQRGRLMHWGGVAAMMGGALWSAWAVLVSLKPEGCIAAECDLPGRSARSYDDLAPVLILAVVLIGAGVVAVAMMARAAGRFGRLGRAGLILGVLGAFALAASLLVQTLFYEGDFPLMPTFVIPGGLALAVGFLLFGISLLRVLPRWAGVLLVLGALAMLGVNDQNERVLLAIPFGIAWMAVGYVLWSGKGEPQATAAVRVA